MSKQAKAAYSVMIAVKNGDLPRLDGAILCVDCGAKAKQYDHRDYDEPLKVEAVCRSCNRKRGPAKDWVPKRDPFTLNVRIHPRIYKTLQQIAFKDHRSATNMATYLLTGAVMSKAIYGKQEQK